MLLLLTVLTLTKSRNTHLRVGSNIGVVPWREVSANTTKQTWSVIAAIPTWLWQWMCSGTWCVFFHGFKNKRRRWHGFTDGKKRVFYIKAGKPNARVKAWLWGGSWGWASQLEAPAARFAHKCNVLLWIICWFCRVLLVPPGSRDTSLALPGPGPGSQQQREAGVGVFQVRVQKDVIILVQGVYDLRSK